MEEKMQQRQGLLEALASLDVQEIEFKAGLEELADRKRLLLKDLIGLTNQINQQLEEEKKNEEKVGE